jgi:adenylate kinase
MIILLLGPPGAGKGTQGERIADHLGIPKIATGDVLRAALRDGTEQGRRAQEYMERGDLVPDEVILAIMKDALGGKEAARGAVLDGVVRTVPQAEGLKRVLADLGRQLDVVLMFDVSEEELVRRLSGRTVCESCQTPYKGREPGTTCDRCGGKLVRRKDDEPEAVRNRMRAYSEQTAPVVEYYRSARNGTRFIEVAAEGDPNEIATRLLSELQG